MEKYEAEAILRQHHVLRSPEDPRTVEQIAEQIRLTGSPKPDTCQVAGAVAVTATPDISSS